MPRGLLDLPPLVMDMILSEADPRVVAAMRLTCWSLCNTADALYVATVAVAPAGGSSATGGGRRGVPISSLAARFPRAAGLDFAAYPCGEEIAGDLGRVCPGAWPAVRLVRAAPPDAAALLLLRAAAPGLEDVAVCWREQLAPDDPAANGAAPLPRRMEGALAALGGGGGAPGAAAPLRRLELLGIPRQAGPWLVATMPALTGLESLRIEPDYTFNRPYLLDVVARLPVLTALRRLSLPLLELMEGAPHGAPSPAAAVVVPSLTRLDCLPRSARNYFFVRGMDPATQVAISRAFPSLEHLHAPGVGLQEAIEGSPTAPLFPHLTRLDVWSLIQPPGYDGRSWKAAPRLRAISVLSMVTWLNPTIGLHAMVPWPPGGFDALAVGRWMRGDSRALRGSDTDDENGRAPPHPPPGVGPAAAPSARGPRRLSVAGVPGWIQQHLSRVAVHGWGPWIEELHIRWDVWFRGSSPAALATALAQLLPSAAPRLRRLRVRVTARADALRSTAADVAADAMYERAWGDIGLADFAAALAAARPPHLESAELVLPRSFVWDAAGGGGPGAVLQAGRATWAGCVELERRFPWLRVRDARGAAGSGGRDAFAPGAYAGRRGRMPTGLSDKVSTHHTDMPGYIDGTAWAERSNDCISDDGVSDGGGGDGSELDEMMGLMGF